MATRAATREGGIDLPAWLAAADTARAGALDVLAQHARRMGDAARAEQARLRAQEAPQEEQERAGGRVSGLEALAGAVAGEVALASLDPPEPNDKAFTVWGRVVRPGGAGVRAIVTAIDPDEQPVGQARTGADGNFTLAVSIGDATGTKGRAGPAGTLLSLRLAGTRGEPSPAAGGVGALAAQPGKSTYVEWVLEDRTAAPGRAPGAAAPKSRASRTRKKGDR